MDSAPAHAPEFSATEREALRALAWGSVREALGCEELPEALFEAASSTTVFGAFVTLRAGERLRGCIGRLGEPGPARALVRSSARSSATADPRFDPVKKDELDTLTLEISLLTPPEALESAARESGVVVGQDGLIVEQGPLRGLLLPQVAAERGWSAKRFLRETCAKAGLPEDAWRDAATDVSRFNAQVF